MNIIGYSVSAFTRGGTATAVVRDAETFAHVAEIDVAYRPRPRVGFGVEVDARDAYGRPLSVNASLFFRAYASINGAWARSIAKALTPDGVGRVLSFDVYPDDDGFDGAIARWKLWADGDAWSEGTPEWRDGDAGFWSALFGPTSFDEKVLASENVKITLPEAQYDAIVEVIEERWSRPRWRGAWHSRKASRVTVRDGVPIPETTITNDTKVYDLRFPCDTVAGAVLAFQQAIHEEREGL